MLRRYALILFFAALSCSASASRSGDKRRGLALRRAHAHCRSMRAVMPDVTPHCRHALLLMPCCRRRGALSPLMLRRHAVAAASRYGAFRLLRYVAAITLAAATHAFIDAAAADAAFRAMFRRVSLLSIITPLAAHALSYAMR